MWETRVWALGWEDSLEKEMATYCSTIAWKIPWTEEPGRLQSMGLQRVWHDWASLRAWSQGLIGYLKEFRFGPMAMESHPGEGWKNWINILGDHSKLQLFSCVRLFTTSGLQHARLPCLSLSPGVCSNSCPLSGWCHPTISSSLALISLCPQSFPASGSFPMSWLKTAIW